MSAVCTQYREDSWAYSACDDECERRMDHYAREVFRMLDIAPEDPIEDYLLQLDGEIAGLIRGFTLLSNEQEDVLYRVQDKVGQALDSMGV